jgi:hypothetical protein
MPHFSAGPFRRVERIEIGPRRTRRDQALLKQVKGVMAETMSENSSTKMSVEPL